MILAAEYASNDRFSKKDKIQALKNEVTYTKSAE